MAYFIAAAITLVPTILFGDDILDTVFIYVEDPRYGSLLASSLIFFLPTAILGMISPYSIRLLIDTTEHSGHVAGRLYFVSTLGSALGTLATSFYLVLYFEVNQILTTMVIVLLIAGSCAIAANKYVVKDSE